MSNFSTRNLVCVRSKTVKMMVDSQNSSNNKENLPTTSKRTIHSRNNSNVKRIRYDFSSTDSDVDENVKSAASGTTDNGKKRKVRKHLWERNVRKTKRTEGKVYINVKGLTVLEKKIGRNCNCKRQCFDRIGAEACRKIFSDFYAIPSKNLQDAYLYGNIQRTDVVRRRPRSEEGNMRYSAFSYVVSPVINTILIL